MTISIDSELQHKKKLVQD